MDCTHLQSDLDVYTRICCAFYPIPVMAEAKPAKEATLKLIERLKDDVTYEDIIYELYVLQK